MKVRRSGWPQVKLKELTYGYLRLGTWSSCRVAMGT